MLEKLALAAHQPADSVLVQNISPSDVVSVNRAVSDALIDPNVTFMLGDYVTVIRGGVVPVQGSYGLRALDQGFPRSTNAFFRHCYRNTVNKSK
jgi:hypothetical protein